MKRFLLSLLVASLLLGSVGALFVTPTASAAVNKDSTNIEKVNAYYYGGWLISCFWEGSYSVDTQATNGESVATGVVGNGKSYATGITPSEKKCNDAGFFKAAIQATGIPWSTQDVLNFMCDTLGATREGSCKDPGNPNTFAVKLSSKTGDAVRKLFIKQAGYDFFSDYENSKLLQYEYWKMMALSNKIGGEDACLTDTSADQAVAGGDVMSINLIQTDGSLDQHLYKYKPQGFIDTHFGTNGKGFLCKEAVAKVNQLAGDPGVQQAFKVSAAAGKATDPNDSVINIGATKGDGDGDTSSCQIDGIGWIICPVVDFMAKIVDQAYTVVSGLLVVQPLYTTGSNPSAEPIFKAWSAMRNIANVCFAIAFLIIIYSQITGAGISNYGVKRMLPRLIIAAVLVNVSFWICAIGIDLSNTIGGSIRDLIGSSGTMGDLLKGVDVPPDTSGSGTGWVHISGTILSGTFLAGTALYVGLSALLPALIAAVVAIVTVFLVLTLRQALIILLVVISPLAFVAFLLPNTEDWFKKWRSFLQTLLLMYPIIALIFGASALASTIVMNSAPEEPKEMRIAVQIMGALISIIPLAITPIVMRTAGGVLNRFGGFINNPNKGPFDRMRKGAASFRQDRQNLRNLRALEGQKQFGRGSLVKLSARRKNLSSMREAELRHATTSYNAKALEENAGYANSAAGGSVFREAEGTAVRRVVASAKVARSKELIENTENLVNTIDKDKASDIEYLKREFHGASDLSEKAAYAKLLSRNGSPGVSALRNALTDYSNSIDRTSQAKISEELNLKDILGSDQAIRNAGRDFEVWTNNEGWVDAAGNRRAGHERTFQDVKQDSSVWRDISAQRFASMSPASQVEAFAQLESANDVEGARKLAQRIVADSTAMGNIKGKPQEIIMSLVSDN